MRPRPGVLLLRAGGVDDGGFGAAVTGELRRELVRFSNRKSQDVVAARDLALLNPHLDHRPAPVL